MARTCVAASAAVFDVVELERRPGLVAAQVTGEGAYEAFQDEAGGHRFQHVPKHDKRGRVHTSTVTVAVLPVPTEVELRLDPRDLEITTCRGSGPGGQHRNKTESVVQIRHRPTGITVRCDGERSQHRNKESAMTLLRCRVREVGRSRAETQRAKDRQNQVGSGQRGDKRRSYYFQRDQVVDHLLGKSWSLKAFLRGEVE